MSNKLLLHSVVVLMVAMLGACFDDEGRAEDLAAAESSTSSDALTQQHQGEATYYRATGKGNCSFPASKDLMVVALNTKDYDEAALCGAYLRVEGPEGSVTVRVTDRCPGCKEGGLDLSQEAFARIAQKSAGRIPVSWQVVPGTVSGPLSYHFKEGSTRYWTAIQVRNHRLPIVSLEIQPEGSSDWLPTERRGYNYFVYAQPLPAAPFKVRVTATSGATLEDRLPQTKGGLLIKGHAQFQVK